jgi:hypothetical protein
MLDAAAPGEPPESVLRWKAGATLLMLVLSAMAISMAPLAMPEGYSWVSNAVSESAAQAQRNAWVGRTGFLLFGLAVLALAGFARERWGSAGTILFTGFGVLMLGTAAFSHKPWQAGVPFDEFEDLLHSITATGMGLSFAVGVVVIALGRVRPTLATRGFDLVAIAASVILPMGMANLPTLAGLLQRVMFLVAYVWFALEAARLSRGPAGRVRSVRVRPAMEDPAATEGG